MEAVRGDGSMMKVPEFKVSVGSQRKSLIKSCLYETCVFHGRVTYFTFHSGNLSATWHSHLPPGQEQFKFIMMGAFPGGTGVKSLPAMQETWA